MSDHRRILIVEDNPQDELLILRALRKSNVINGTMVVRDGQQALDYLFKEGEFEADVSTPPSVVLLDIGLPRVSGLEVLRQLRAHADTCLLPVVILTSSDEEEDRLRSYENGANSFVRKPLDFGAFAKIVADVGGYWLVVNIPPPEETTP